MLTKQNARRAAWLVGIAAIALVLCSKSSPLYVLNDWMDANIFFTMGKSMFRGKVLYRDVFDHKGPVLYFLYGLASLIDYTGFTGVLVVEIIAFALFLHCGLRVTDDATMEIVQQVLAGKVNKDLVAKLRGRGVGLCGMDGQMLRCTELDPALGHVGEIIHVDPTLISTLLDGGYIPVIATVGMDDLGQAYNVNADTAAAQIAIALKAEKLVSMTDIAGLLRDKDDETTLIPEVEVSEIEGYKAAGIIAGGMIPKIGGMADAIYQGVHEAVIIDGRVPHSILLELFSNRGSGTRFYRRSHQE